MEVSIRSSLTLQHIDTFKTIVGKQFVFVDEENLYKYSHDETENLHYLPEVVIKPRSAEEISEIFKICNQYGRWNLKKLTNHEIKK